MSTCPTVSVQLNSPETVQHYASVLPVRELEACCNAGTRQMRELRIVSRGLLRETLSLYIANSASKLSLTRLPHGKPALAWDGSALSSPRIKFNASNTTNCVGEKLCQGVKHAALCPPCSPTGSQHTGVAISNGLEVGFDLESSRRMTRKQPLTFARRRFSPIEIEAIEGRLMGSRLNGLCW